MFQRDTFVEVIYMYSLFKFHHMKMWNYCQEHHQSEIHF